MSSSSNILSSSRQLKREMRKTIQSILGNLSNELVDDYSDKITKRVLAIPEIIENKKICIYLAMPTKEVRTNGILTELFNQNKTIFIPRVTGSNSADMIMPQVESLAELRSMKMSKWGIPEFSEDIARSKKDALSSLAEVVIAPGVAFTPKGHRLGHGKGYYDCFLQNLQDRRMQNGLAPAFVVGIGFDEQIVPILETNEHDVTLDAIVTPSALYRK